MNGKVKFIQEFRDTAHQLRDYTTAGNWMRLAEALETAGVTLTAADAAAWADRGYLPEEAGQYILDGANPDMAGAASDAAVAADGGPEAHLRAQLLRLAGDNPGLVIDPDVADRLGLDG